MKNIINRVSLAAGQVNRQHIQIVIIIVTLSLLALGAGAPAGGGDTLPGL